MYDRKKAQATAHKSPVCAIFSLWGAFYTQKVKTGRLLSIFTVVLCPAKSISIEIFDADLADFDAGQSFYS